MKYIINNNNDNLIIINDSDNFIFAKINNNYWSKRDYNQNGEEIYYENSNGYKKKYDI